MTTELALGMIIATLTPLVGYLGLRARSRADTAVSQTAAAAQEDAANAALYAGYGGLLQHIQEDNADLRRRLIIAEEAASEVPDLKRRLAICEERTALLQEKLGAS